MRDNYEEVPSDIIDLVEADTEPEAPPVRGRGALVSSAQLLGDRIILRIDDDRRPEFWAEITLNEPLLRSYLQLLTSKGAHG